MRRVGELSSEAEAQSFHDVLFARGIENTPESEDGGGISIWVHDDDQIAEAARLLALFRSTPDAPEFREATTKSAAIRASLAKSERSRRSAVIDEARVGYERNFLSEGWVAILLLVLSLAVTFYTDFFANEKAMRLIQISQVPYIRELPGGGSLFLPEIKAGEVWRLITPIFAHGNLMHILFNMLWLVQLGRFIEARFGAAKLLALIMVVAVGSNLGEYLWKSPYFGGMSGVNYGLFGFLWMKGKFDRGQNWQLPVQTVQLMLMWMVLCYTGLMGPVANAAHTVGLIIGVLCGLGSARLVPWLERSSR